MKSELFKLTKGKVISLILTFFLVFFIRRDALFNVCNWARICPDFIGTRIISIYPNFYRPFECGFGIAGKICWEASWHLSILIKDIIIFIIINLIIFYLISRYKRQE